MIEEYLKDIRGYRHPNGRWYIATGSVLDILAPARMEWIAEEDLAIGSACHKEMETCLNLLKDGGDPYEICTLSRVKKFLDWFTRQQFTILSIEKPQPCELYGFAGCADIVVLDNMLQGLVLEAKYAEALNDRYEVQAESYIHLDAHKGFKAALVQITRAGDVNPKPLKPNPRHWAGFLSGLGVHKWREK